jgi:uncharacterized cupin superfamily protein
MENEAGRDPILLAPGEGTRYRARGSEMVYKALASSTEGRFSFVERVLPPGGRMPPPHRHLASDEGFYVLDGEVTFLLDSGEHLATKGWWALVPGGAAHTFGNRSERPASVLVVHAPPLDAYFAELDELWRRAEPPSSEEERELMRRHEMEPVELAGHDQED